MTSDQMANVTGIAEWHYVINTGRRPPFSIRLAQRPRFTHVLFKRKHGVDLLLINLYPDIRIHKIVKVLLV